MGTEAQVEKDVGADAEAEAEAQTHTPEELASGELNFMETPPQSPSPFSSGCTVV